MANNGSKKIELISIWKENILFKNTITLIIPYPARSFLQKWMKEQTINFK